MGRPDVLKFRIEKERKELNLLAERYGLRDTRVLKQSMLLDSLINMYNQTRYSLNKSEQPIA